MTTVVIIDRPDVVALVQDAARKFTAGDETEAVGLAMRRLLDEKIRAGSLFGAHPGSVRVNDGDDLTAPILTDELDAEIDQKMQIE